jgi:hypothetical protein
MQKRRGWVVLCAVAIVAGSLGASVRSASAQGTADADAGVVVAPAKTPDETPPLRGLFPEPRLMTRGLAEAAKRIDKQGPKRDGFYVRVGTGVTGAGWIAAGPGYRHRLPGSPFTVDAFAALSWRAYKIAQVKTSGSWLDDRVNAGVQAVWEDRTQADYFGTGSSSALGQRTGYRLRGSDYTVFAGFGALTSWRIDLRGGLLVNPRISSAVGWSDPKHPDAVALFDEGAAPALTASPNLRHAEVAVTRNRLNNTAHPTRGGLIQVAAGTYHDQTLHRYSFNRYELALLRMVPVVRDLWTLALHGAFVGSTTSGINDVPFYLLPTLGANNALRGYPSHRFVDRNLAVMNVESRWAVLPHMDGVFFVDAGQVASKANAFARRNVKTSYGMGARIHTGKTTMVRIDFARSVEGWQLMFRTNEPMLLSVLKRGIGIAPMLP